MSIPGSGICFGSFAGKKNPGFRKYARFVYGYGLYYFKPGLFNSMVK
jgi:hypothetical protein